jgi:transposase
MHIVAKKIRGIAYYYAQSSFREKLDAQATGKGKGSGKSRVRTESIYLGTAEAIVTALKEARAPVEVRHREFGFVAAVYQTAVELGVPEALQKHVPGERFGTPRWLYFLLPIINRLQHATSKARMGEWAASTVLPTLLDFDPKRLNSQTFWYVTDDLISEKELQERREKDPSLDDALFAGLDDHVFRKIEEEVLARLRERFPFQGNILLYDTTNFFTYIEEPVRSKLARTGHNKDCHHHLRQIGLALCVDKEWGIPLFYRMYRGNSQDAKTFAQIVDELLACLRAGFSQIDTLVLVLDKGNNREETFDEIKGKILWVGSLVPSHHEDLMALPLEQYEGHWDQRPSIHYHACRRTVMGVEATLVLTYCDKLRRKQEHTLENALDKLRKKLNDRWAEYKRKPKQVPKTITRMLRESHYEKCLTVCIENETLAITQTEELKKRKRRFGKNLLFSPKTDDDPNWIITQYHAKDPIEDSFKLLKDPELIRWRPCRHWTDTKIRAYGFCCIMALLIIRVMELKAANAGLRMSPAVLKRELDDLREITMLYDKNTAKIKVSSRSSIQQNLWELFNLQPLENRLTLHNTNTHLKE